MKFKMGLYVELSVQQGPSQGLERSDVTSGG